MPLPLRHRMKRAWAVLRDREPCSAASVAEIRTILNRLRYAAKIKELPMAIIDDINALDNAIAAALSAKDNDAAANVAALADAKQQITTLTDEISTADAAVVALTAKYAPTPVAATSSTDEAPAA